MHIEDSVHIYEANSLIGDWDFERANSIWLQLLHKFACNWHTENIPEVSRQLVIAPQDIQALDNLLVVFGKRAK